MNPFIVAEIGINHNGDIDLAKKLIDGAVDAKCDAVKFQKRTIDIVYTAEELNTYRESPWGTTNREQKEGLEFGKNEYDEIDKYCKEKKYTGMHLLGICPVKNFATIRFKIQQNSICFINL